MSVKPSNSKFVYNLISCGTQIENTFLNAVRVKYIKQDIVNVFKLEDVKTLHEKVNDVPPFFSDKYLLIVYTRDLPKEQYTSFIKLIDKLVYYDVIIINNKRELYDLLAVSITDVECMNFYTPPEWLVDLHLKGHLTAKLSIAGRESFYKRMKRQWKYLDEFILQLNVYYLSKSDSNTDDVSDEVLLSDSEVKKIITPAQQTIDFDSLVLDMLKQNDMSNHIKVLSNYRYADKFLYRECKKRLDLFIEVKKHIILGNLNSKTIIQFAKQHQINLNELETIFEYLNLPSTKIEFLHKVRRKLEQDYKDDIVGFILDNGVLNGVRRQKYEIRDR